ncbi:hypothetical protein FKW77_010490 [Venturia effusa]|uniref:Uncharacterized protein n=1 Tax=Venturia effusa TaxID=50376 RepID=A0A517L4K3_9PEZI|nr:hypothetical protein FKW77_010490 [Venturia effusa]
MDSSSGPRPSPSIHEVRNAFQSPTFDRDVQIRVNETVGSASVSPSGRDVALASAEGLHIIDLDSPYSPPRHLAHQQQWPPADVQWSPFAARDHWVVSTSNQKALVWNLDHCSPRSPIEHTLHAHSRAITDINFSAHHPHLLATCAVDSYVHCWDLRRPTKPVNTFADWNAGATQVKWNRQDEHILASSHDKFLKIWDDRKGAYPLKVIEAHSTKIYGVDWNRTDKTAILTCSLDKSIKFWDYSRNDNDPERVIRTQFPVWRARHTPFGWGVLALPQRGDYDLHLYNRQLDENNPRIGFAKPVHAFQGHAANVKEFLWRTRGHVENGIDNRDFQLISWGMDRDLHLHRIDPQVLKGVGHEKGRQVRKSMPLTRQGAEYKSFRDRKTSPAKEEQLAYTKPGLLGNLVSAAGMSKMPLPMAPGTRESGFMTYSGRQHKRAMDPIKWMGGVTMGRRQTETGGRSGNLENDEPESLSNEMTTVSTRYTKVKFEKADVHGREATVTLNGPWGSDEKPVFLRVHFDFPSNYPSGAAAVCSLEKTVAGISGDMIRKLNNEVKSIIHHYQARRIGCLEAVITYLLGERGLEESITLPALDGPFVDVISPGDESSSDEDDAVPVAGRDLETSIEGALPTTNIPLPRKCGAYWSPDGRLVCFFEPKPEPKPKFSLETKVLERAGRSHRHFEGFGRLLEDSPSSKKRTIVDEENSDEESSGSWTGSSSSSSDGDASEDFARLPSRFHPPAAWRPETLRFLKTSSRSSSGYARHKAVIKAKSVLVVHDLSDLLPSKLHLAGGYQIFGNGPEVCAHNAEVASRFGQHGVAAVWEIASHILCDEVPLEIMEQNMRKEPILVVATRQIIRVRRKDSGLDLHIDNPISVSNPKLTGRVKWGTHPFGSAWLIPELFAHFEKLADIQMLAMLSCIFSEPAAQEGVSNALMGSRQENLPMPIKAPAFSLDYFPSRDVAWSLFKEPKVVMNTVSMPSTIANPIARLDYFGSRIGVYGSAESSNGPWERDRDLLMPSAPPTPYSTGTTPPGVLSTRSHRNSIINSLSTSPEQRVTKRTNSNLSAAFSSFSRPFAALGTSPDRFRSDGDLSTSAPTSGITWGSNTFYSSSSNSPEKRRRTSSRRSSFKTHDSTYSSDEDYCLEDSDDGNHDYSAVKSSRATAIKTTFKNQNQFEEEACASLPLLPEPHACKYDAYRTIYADQLSAWGLYIQRAEILKFNGLTNYWPVEMSSSRQHDAVPSRHAPDLPSPIPSSNRATNIAREQLIHRSGPPNASASSGTSFDTNTTNICMPTNMYLSSDQSDTNPQHTREERDWKHDETCLNVTEHLRCSCCWCYELVEGIYVTCSTFMHRAHFECHDNWMFATRHEESMYREGASCGCAA